ncbi:hypothetical protein [Falsiroseomonas sp.]|uniref:hypothetical protein n=1 Tax=Falsiroseomonas sp. TaxID=2870721 RepID=UPI0035693826
MDERSHSRPATRHDEGAPDPEAERYRATTNKKQGPQVDGQGEAAETVVDEHGRARDLPTQGRAPRKDEKS